MALQRCKRVVERRKALVTLNASHPSGVEETDDELGVRIRRHLKVPLVQLVCGRQVLLNALGREEEDVGAECERLRAAELLGLVERGKDALYPLARTCRHA